MGIKMDTTEMLLVKVVNDLLKVCDKKSASLLMSLDLSAAFDTVDQRKKGHSPGLVQVFLML